VRGEEDGVFANPPALSFSPKTHAPILSLSLYSFQIAPELIINYGLNTVKP
jgi:hypothetical protein